MTLDRKTIFVFDLDNTLGRKTPTYPNITIANGDFIRYISSLQNTAAIVATGRPRTQARVGLSKGGISPKEMYALFSGGVFEDGLYVEDGDGEIYNALDDAPKGFISMRNAFYKSDLSDFLESKGYSLYTYFVVRQSSSGDRISYELLDFHEEPIGEYAWSPLKNVKILYLQGNDVRATLKAPIGFRNNDLDLLEPYFTELKEITAKFMKIQNPKYQESVHHVTWKDATEIYPKFDEEAFRKGRGIDMILERIDPNKEARLVLCVDGENDFSLVDHVSKTYLEYRVLMPSNANEELVKRVLSENMPYAPIGFCLEQDCTEFGKGALPILEQLLYI